MNQNNAFADSLILHIITIIASPFSAAFRITGLRPFSFKDPFNQFAFIIGATPSIVIITHPFLKWLLAAFALHRPCENLPTTIVPSRQSSLVHFHFDFDLIIHLPLLIAFNRRSFFKFTYFLY